MDIFTNGDPVALIGSAWYACETSSNKHFRWVGDDARINVGQLTHAAYSLVIDVEPGPAVGNSAFDLVVLEAEKPIATVRVRGHETVRIPLEAAAPRVRMLTLRAVNGGKTIPAPGDTRTMKFRVFKIAVERTTIDVVSAANGLTPGKGWYQLETYKGETFRWVGAEATIELQPGAKTGAVTLEVEPGPGVNFGPLKLQVFAGDEPCGNVIVKHREPVIISWPESDNSTIRLRVEGGGKVVPNDARVLNFRAFATVE